MFWIITVLRSVVVFRLYINIYFHSFFQISISIGDGKNTELVNAFNQFVVAFINVFCVSEFLIAGNSKCILNKNSNWYHTILDNTFKTMLCLSSRNNKRKNQSRETQNNRQSRKDGGCDIHIKTYLRRRDRIFR